MQKMMVVMLVGMMAGVPLRADAGNKFYVGIGGATAVGNIDTSADDTELRSFGWGVVTPIDMGNSGAKLDLRLGYRFAPWLDLELERHTASFFWQRSSPAYNRYTGQFTGIITFSLDKDITVYSLSPKLKVPGSVLKPYLTGGLGLMKFDGTARVALQEINWDVANYLKETKLCGKLGGGLELNLYKDRVSLFAEGARWQGLAGDEKYGAKAVAYWNLAFGLQAAF